MFSFLDMADDYEDRKVDCFETKKVLVDTCAITDSDKPYETAVKHKSYNDNELVIVELYDTKSEAKKGHEKWVKKMTSKKLPSELKDVSSSEIAKLAFGDKKIKIIYKKKG